MTRSLAVLKNLLFASVLLFHSLSSAETIELVTYYPATAGGNLDSDRIHAGRATIGDPYSLDNPADADLPNGTLLVSGRVGIGTDDPGSLLQVVSENAGGAGDGIDILGDTPRLFIGEETTGSTIGFGAASSADNFGQGTLAGDASVFAQGGNLRFSVGPVNSNPPVRMSITQAGNVGIGVPAPVTQLELPQNTAVKVGHAHLSSGVGTGGEYLAHLASNAWWDGAQWQFSAAGRKAGVLQVQDDQLIFYQNTAPGSQSFNTALIVGQSGNVGVGGVLPTVALEVPNDKAIKLGDAYISSGFAGHANLASNGWFRSSGWVIPDSGKKSFLWQVRPEGAYFWATNTAGGTDWQLRHEIRPNGDVYVNGTIVHSSDARQKKQVVAVADALSRVASLRGVNFHWKAPGKSESLQMGLLAQDVEKAFPELVYTGPDGMKSVAYAQLTGALVEAVKDLKSEVESLRAEVRQLRLKQTREPNS